MLLYLVASLDLGFLIGVLVVGGLAQDELRYGLPAPLVIGLAVPLLSAALTAALAMSAVLTWHRPYGSLSMRGYYSLVTLSAIVYLPYLAYWNLLGFRY